MQSRALADGVVIDGKIINKEIAKREKELRNYVTENFSNNPAELGERYRIGLINLEKQYGSK